MSDGRSGLWKNELKLLLRNRRQLLVFQLIYALLVLVILLPAVNQGISLAMKSAGCSYLTSENIIYFLGRPITILILLGILFVGGVFLYFGMAYTMTCLMLAKEKKRRSFLVILRETFRRFWIIILPRNYMMPFLVVLLALFFNIPLLIVVLSRMRASRFFIKSAAGIPFVIPVLIAAAVILSILLFLFVFVLPYSILEHKSTKKGIKASLLLEKRNRLKVLFFLLVFNLGMGLVCVLLYGAAVLISALFAKVFVQKDLVVAVFLSVYNDINLYAAVLTGFLGVILNTGLVTSMYFTLKQKRGEEFEPIMGAPELFHTRKKLRRSIIASVIAGLFIVDILYTYDMIRNGGFMLRGNLEYITITSHRGDSYKAPENTIPAVQSAIDSLANAVEIDVQQTKDGTVVLFHDSSLYRLTGSRLKIRNMNFADVEQVDVGRWFGEEFIGTHIPELEEVLKLCKGKVTLNIDLKYNSSSVNLAQQVVALIEEYDFEKQCVVTSAVYQDLVEIKALNEQIKTGYILSAGYSNFYNKSDAADFFSIRSDFVSESLVRNIHANGKAVHVWTVNSRKEMERMKQTGVDSIITDRPVLAREVIYGEETGKNVIDLLNMVY